MMRIAVAGGSDSNREALRAALLPDPAIEVAMLGSSVTAAAVKRLEPSLVVLLMDSPEQAVETARQIMADMPMPIVLVASSRPQDGDEILARSGALALLELPLDAGQQHRFVTSLQAMAEVKVVRRWRRSSGPARNGSATPSRQKGQLVVIASSTGGPGALQQIFSELPPDFAAPIVVVQHIAGGFADSLVRSLSETNLVIKLAQAGETLEPGTVYFAPDNWQLGVSPRNVITLSADPPIEGFQPSATYLFEAAARAFGSRLTAVILTGMGRDGVAGLRHVREFGGTVIAQDQDSSIVFGMPKAAIESGFVDQILPLGEIARALAAATKREGIPA
jgi:two-component system chemotaxis response regulator CheB